MPGPTIVPTTQAAEVPIDPLLQKPSAPAPNRAGVVHRLLKKGARFGIEHEMFRSIQAVIDTGRARDLDAAPSTYSSWERKYQQLFAHLLAIAPEMPEQLTLRGPTASMELAEILERGRTRERSNLVNSFKANIRDWMKFSPELPLEKQFRGFNCESSGALLCPVTYKYGDQEVQVALLEYRADYPAGHEDYPSFLWHGHTANPDDYLDGFGKGLLVSKGLQNMLISPLSAKSSNGGTSLSKRKGRARIHNIVTVTPAMIALVACLIHFGLSSQPTFSAGSPSERGKFYYEGFYNSLIHTIEEVMPADRRVALLAYHAAKVLNATRELAEQAGTQTRKSTIAGLIAAQTQAATDVAAANVTPGAHAAAAVPLVPVDM